VSLTEEERQRYSRHLVLKEIGPEGQEQIGRARVLIVGLGGLGSPAALYLAAAGVGTLGVLDCDRIELSNLQRQVLFDSASVGSEKAFAAQARLRALNPAIQVIAHATELNASNARELLSGYDIVVDGTDRLLTRYLINDACVLLGKPLVSAAIYRFEGQAFTYVPGRGPCYRCAFPQPAAEAAPSCAEAGVLGVLPGVLGAIQATEVLKLITRIGEPLVGRLLTYDALEMRFRDLKVRARSDCPVCGTHPSITDLAAPQDLPGSAAVQVRRLAPEELQALLDRQETAGTLHIVDVREANEFAAGHLVGATNIALGALPARLSELATSTTVLFVCRSGVRSARAAELASRAGVPSVAHLEGGLLAWAARCDPALKVA
jgi:molybdopterin/thiamine biosynthesis adenylyltransferase/rhodanese-related sulfurtransferase